MTRCRGVSSFLEPYADGELSPDKIIEVEQHLEGCERCRAQVRLDASLKRSIQRSVRAAAPVTPAFMARLSAALEAEREREAELIESEPPRPRMLPWRVTASLAAAAALVLVWGATQKNSANESAKGPDQSVTDMNTMNVDQFIDDLVNYHLQPQQPAVTEPAALEQFDPDVGVPVRLPRRLSEYGARWEGGSVVPIRNRRAALLRYHVGGHKMTLYVYDAARVPLESRLKPRVVRNEPVYVGWERGFTIAATERRGVGYAAVATDMNDQESAEIVASLHAP